MKTIFLVPNNSMNQNVVRDVLYGGWCSGKLIGGGTVPPLSLLSTATVCRDAGLDILFIDALGERLSQEQTIQRAKDAEVVVVLTSFMTFKEDIAYLTALKNDRPDRKFILFGAQPTFLPEISLSNDIITALVLREPEHAMRDLLLAFRDNADWRSTPGIAYKENGVPQVNEPYPFIKNLDELPIPDRSLLPQGVRYYNPLIQEYPYTTLLTSRGCPSKCTYCTAPHFMGGTLRAQSADMVAREIIESAEMGYKTLYFRDESFTAFKKRNYAAWEQALSKGVKVRWVGNCIAGELDEEYLLFLKKTGLECLKFGVETGNEDILKRVNKKSDLQRMRHDFALCRKHGIRTHAHCMLGMPGETRETIENTFKFIHEIKPTTVTYSVCSPYPGTPLYAEVQTHNPDVGITTADDLEIQGLHVTSRYNEMFTSLTNEEIEAAVQEGYRRFYARPSYILQRFFQIRSAKEFFSLAKAGLNVLGFSLSGKK